MKPARLQVGVDISKQRLDVCLLSPLSSVPSPTLGLDTGPCVTCCWP